MNSADLLSMARSLGAESNRNLGSSRFLASTLLLRQSLENALDDFWSRTVPGLVNVSNRAQLIALPFYLDRELALRVQYAWYQLSGYCHHDAYELPAPAHELEICAAAIEGLIGAGESAEGSNF
jgi:hypothetical protein